METLLNYIQLHIPWLIEYKYLFFFLGALIEGMNTMVFGGFVAALGGVHPFWLFVVMCAGHTISGYGWYYIGYFGGATVLDKWGHKEKLSHDMINKASFYFEKYSGRAILITKFTLSFQIAILIMAGALRFNIKKFSKYNFIGSIGWTIITIVVGYVFGQSFNLFNRFLKNFTYFIMFLAGAIILIYSIKIALRSKFIKSLEIYSRVTYLNSMLKNKFDNLLSHKNND